MRMPAAVLAAIVLAMGGSPSGAQEGHPLTGTWAGEWESAPGRRTRVTVVMNWDGKAVTGIINPGPDAIPLTRVTPDWSTWTVRLEAEPPSTAKSKRVSAEGRLHDIGSSRRRIVGTWSEDGVRGAVTLTRE